MNDIIIKLAEEVYSELGSGYSERVYHNAMEVQLRLNNIQYETERTIQLFFKTYIVGSIRADLLVNGSIVVELKSTSKIKNDDVEQCKRYMKLLNYKQGIVINFPEKGEQIEIIEIE
jgi:GxxExxY protein